MRPLGQHVTWTQVDGVRTAWMPGPEPLTATLVFGVGRRDETFALGGLTHLVEHLVMATLPKSHLDHNAGVGPSTTQFTATGAPAAVGEFLERVCRALSDLPLERLAAEARVLAAEEASRPPSLVGEAMLARYGARGLGLLGMAEPQVPQLTAEQVTGHAATALTRGNAVLWLTGEPPADWRLPLPEGPRLVREDQAPVDLVLPAVRAYESPEDVVVTVAAAYEPGLLAGLRIALDRAVDRLRHVEGRTYHVDLDVEVAGAGPQGEVHVSLVADASAEHAGEVAAGIVTVLQDLAADGPTEAELAHDADGFAALLSDPRAVPGFLDRAVERALLGAPVPDPQEALDEQRALTCAQVRDAVARALPSALVLVPEAVADELDSTRSGAVVARGPVGLRKPAQVLSEGARRVLGSLALVPEFSSRTVEGRVLKPTWRGEMPRLARMILGEDGVSIAFGPAVMTVLFDELVALGTQDGDHEHLHLVAADGLTVTVCAQDWRRGQDAVAHVLARAGSVPTFRTEAQ